MKILLDECMPLPLITRLSDLPHIIEHAVQLGLAGLPNGAVYEFAVKHHSLFISNDRHFRRSSPYPPTSALGIVFVRIAPCTTESVADPLRKLLTTLQESQVIGRLIALRKFDWEFRS